MGTNLQPRNQRIPKIYKKQFKKISKTTNAASKRKPVGNKCEGLTFVVTGKVEQFKNRDVLSQYIESQGGKVVGSVSKNTNFLVNNDFASTSSKNKKAQELGVPIITEQEFVEKFGK